MAEADVTLVALVLVLGAGRRPSLDVSDGLVVFVFVLALPLVALVPASSP